MRGHPVRDFAVAAAAAEFPAEPDARREVRARSCGHKQPVAVRFQFPVPVEAQQRQLAEQPETHGNAVRRKRVGHRHGKRRVRAQIQRGSHDRQAQSLVRVPAQQVSHLVSEHHQQLVLVQAFYEAGEQENGSVGQHERVHLNQRNTVIVGRIIHLVNCKRRG